MAKRDLSGLLSQSFSDLDLNRNSNTEIQTVPEVPLSSIHINPHQPRKYINPHDVTDLAQKIKKHGFKGTIWVRPLPQGSEGQYELIAGEHRYRAAQEAGLQTIPIDVSDVDDNTAFELSLAENLLRKDLSPVEETEGLLDLMARRLKCSQVDVVSILNLANNAQNRRYPLKDNVILQLEEIAKILADFGKGTPDSFRANRLPLLNLPSEILESLRQGQLAYTKAKEIAKVKDEAARETLLKDSIAQSLSLTQIKEQVKVLRPPKKSDEGLQSRWKNTTKRINQSKLWDDPKRSKKLESLLNQIDKLLEEE